MWGEKTSMKIYHATSGVLKITHESHRYYEAIKTATASLYC